MSGNLTDGVPSAASADDLAVLTCLFSAEPHARRAANFRVFSERMGANLFTAEIAYGTMPWLTEAGPRTLHFRGGPRHVLWQKERLLNALMERLPERYRYVAWVDGDILFDRVDWMAGAVGLLERSPVIQLFDSVRYLDETGRPAGEKRGLISAAASAGADAFANRAGAAGFAWAARREVVASTGLLDILPLGGADTYMAGAFAGVRPEAVWTLVPPVLREAMEQWADRSFAMTRGSVGCLAGSIAHLYHGPLQTRFYLQRHKILRASGFSPAADLVKDSNGLYAWTGRNPPMQAAAAAYFLQRSEEENV